MFASPRTSAEVILTEDFNYPVGNLYGQGGWLQSNNKTNPIQVTSNSFALDGFASGRSVQLTPVNSQDQDCQKPFYPAASDGTFAAITDGPVYVAMLINVQNVTDAMYFSALGTINYNNKIVDGASFTGPYGCTYVVPAGDGKYTVGIAKGSSGANAVSEKVLDYNTTNLVVLKYTIVEGTTNDTFEAWINPVPGSAEPATVELSASTSQGDPTRGIASVAICQTTGSVKKCPEMLVGPIRVATNWSELWSASQGGEDPVEKPEIAVSKPRFEDGFALYQYQKYPVSVKVKAVGITEDIAVAGSAALVPAVSVIPAAEACSGDGYALTFTLNASAGAPISEALTFTSGDVTASLPVSVTVYPAKSLTNFRALPNMEQWETYYFSGSATVTYVDRHNSKIYLQDILGGMALSYAYTGLDNAPFKAGDKLTGLYLLATEPAFGVPGCELMAYFAPEGISYGSVTETGVEKAPVELTLAELADNLDTYLNRLVKVSDVTFEAAGQNFSTTGTTISSGGSTGKIRVFAGTDIAGTAIPATAAAVTGISTSPSSVMLTMRSSADLTAAPEDEEALEVESELLVDGAEYYPVNVATPFARFTVKARNLSAPAAIYITGKDRDQFAADMEEIPAGTGEYLINITFNPVKTGRLQANLMIDTSNTELTYNKGFAGLAYDPEHLPSFTVDTSGLTDFVATVGERLEQTIAVNATGLLDYGAVRVISDGPSSFIISSTMFLKEGTTQLRITYAPTAEGASTAFIEFSSPKAETVTITVHGSTQGSVRPGDKEGDELAFDTSAPLTYYATDFSGSGAKNKPLTLDGWKNVAVDGNRAWWSYTDDENNTSAKVTSYIWGGATVDEPAAEMLLLSPALDYRNCTSRLLSFRIKGELLSDSQVGRLSVLYIDPELPEDERYQVLLGGADIPNGEAASGQWQEYVIDLEGLDLADVFFVGFHYLSLAGANSSESYYVDDFCYGSTTQPFIRIDRQQLVVETVVGTPVDMETINVTGLNLSEPIQVALEGKYKDFFTGAPAELPAEGGQLSFKYEPTEEGEHAVYVNLSSHGAPQSYLTIGGYAKQETGVSLPGVENAARVKAYDLNGREVVAETEAELAFGALRALDKGIYILHITGRDGSVKSLKYLRP